MKKLKLRKVILETERLILRKLTPSDVDDMFELDSDPEVHRFIGKNPVTTKQQSADVIAAIRNQYTEHGIGRWAVIKKETNEFIGWSGLKWMTFETNKHIHYYDLGYRFKSNHWGQGFASEAASKWLEYAFTTLNAKEVYAMANIENEGSNKVLRKLGFTTSETFDFEGIIHHWYKIERAF